LKRSQKKCAAATTEFTRVRRRTAKLPDGGNDDEEIVKLKHDPEIDEMQSSIDNSSVRLAHASENRRRAQEHLNKTLDDLLKKNTA